MLCPLKLSGFVVHQINASHKHIQVNRRECRIALYIKFPSYCTLMLEMELYCFNFIYMVCTMIYMGYTLFGNPQGCWQSISMKWNFSPNALVKLIEKSPTRAGSRLQRYS